MATKKSIQTNCANCERETRQYILFLKKDRAATEYTDFVTDYMTLECGGCESISFLRREYIHDALPDDDMQYIDYNYSGRSDLHDIGYSFLREEDHEELPGKLYDLYEEIKSTFRSDSNIMAGMGLRTLVEAICLQQKIPGRTLQNKIRQMHERGLISGAELPILDKLRLIGNDSAHQIKAFSIDKLTYALEIINHVLKSIYILPKINKRLKL